MSIANESSSCFELNKEVENSQSHIFNNLVCSSQNVIKPQKGINEIKYIYIKENIFKETLLQKVTEN